MNIFKEQKIASKREKAVADKPRQKKFHKNYYIAAEVLKRYSDFILVLLFFIIKYLAFYQILYDYHTKHR